MDIKLGTTFTLFQPGRKRLNPSYFLCVFRDTDANETRQAITQSIGDAVGPLLLELTEGTSDPLDGVVQLYSGDWVLTVYEQTSATNLDAANADRNVWTELVRVSAQCDADPGPEPYDPCAGCVEVATTVNGEESDTPTITVLQGGIEVGTLNPATGVVTIEECPEGCTDPYTIKWDVDGTEITILVDNDPCGGEAVLSCDTLIDAVVVEGAGTENVNGLYTPNPSGAIQPENPPQDGSTIYSLVTDGVSRTLYQTQSPVWSIFCPVSMEFLYEDTTGAAVDPWDGDWGELLGDAPAPTVRQATIADLCGGAPVPCEDASVTWDGEPLLTIPSGGTQDLDCNTLVNAAYAVDGGSVTGTYKPDGTLNSREVFRLDPTHNFQYTGTRWRLVKPGIDYDAALGSETKPWDADWSATPVTVTQATIGAYCDDCEPCEPVTIQLRDTAANPIGAPDVYPAGTTTTKTAPDATITVNSAAFGNALSNGSLDVPVKDGTGTAVGSKVGSDWIVPTAVPLCTQLGAVASGDVEQDVYDCLTSASQEALGTFYYTAALCSDADAARYIATLQAKDGQMLEPGVRAAICALFQGLKADGIYTALQASALLVGARTLNACLTNLNGVNCPSNNNFVDADYNRKTGLIGDGSTKWLMTNRNNNADGQNAQSMGVYIHTANGQGGAYMGAGTADNGTNIISRRATPNEAGIFTRHRTATAATAGANGTSTGLFGISRSVSTEYIVRVGQANTTVTQTSQTPIDRQMAVFASQGASTPFGFGTGRYQFYWQGSALDMALLESRINTYLTAIAAAIP